MYGKTLRKSFARYQEILEMPLSEEEREALTASAEQMREAIGALKL